MAMHQTVACELRMLFRQGLAPPVRVHIDTRAKIDERQCTLRSNGAR
jgi:hypothetical protein